MEEKYNEDTVAIEITFPVAVNVTGKMQQRLVELIGQICDEYEAQHPDRVMWPAGIGCKPTFIPMTPEEEVTRGMEFDESVFSIECCERENYDHPANQETVQ